MMKDKPIDPIPHLVRTTFVWEDDDDTGRSSEVSRLLERARKRERRLVGAAALVFEDVADTRWHLEIRGGIDPEGGRQVFSTVMLLEGMPGVCWEMTDEATAEHTACAIAGATTFADAARSEVDLLRLMMDDPDGGEVEEG